MHTLYLGPSWAVQSFESTQGLQDPVKTNLAQELQLTDYTSLASYANSNLDQLQKAKAFIQQHPELAPFRIVFVMANSLQDGYKIAGVSQVDFARTFLTSADPIGTIKTLEQQFYYRLNSIGIPVALIGAHTDVECESFDNITVIHQSWQNFLGQRCGLNSFYGWPADVGHRWLQGIVIPEYGPPEHFELGIDPSKSVVDEIHKLFNVNWRILENNRLFKGAHPTILGNQLFAQEIKQSVNNWIDKHQ
jgi:hypothetical protein